MSVRITVTIDVRPELTHGFEALADTHCHASQLESGCIDFAVYRNGHSRYVLVEEFIDYYAVLAHRRTNHYRRWREEIGHYQAKPRKHDEVCDVPKQKVLSQDALCELLHGRHFVFTNGCFDAPLHPGHLHTLTWARIQGPLVVGVNTDESMERIKRKPVLTCADRCLLLAGLSAVSFVVPFSEDAPFALIRRLNPSLVVKGPDYTGREHECSDSCPVLIAPPCDFTRHSSEFRDRCIANSELSE